VTAGRSACRWTTEISAPSRTAAQPHQQDAVASRRAAPRLLYLVGDDVFFCSHRLPLARAAAQAGYQVTVATHVTTFGPTIAAAGCRVVPLRLRRATTNPWAEVASVAELVGLYRRERPDLVHHVALKPVVYGSIAARIARVPHVVNAVAGLGWVFLSRSPVALALRPVLLGALKGTLTARGARVIVQNPDDRDLLVTRHLARAAGISMVRGSGVDLAEFAASPLPDTKPPIVVLPARLLKEKGVAEFAEAARLLRREGVAVRCALVGAPDPSNRGAVPARDIAAWVAEGIVEAWGHRTDMPAVLRSSTIVCLPTYREGLPKALLEAAAAGRPVVATDVPGCREVVREGENGLLVPPRDSVALAAALRALLGDRARAAAMGARGRSIAEREFSVERVVEQTLGIYANLLGGAPDSAEAA